MATSYRLIGTLGGGKITEGRFWFRTAPLTPANLEKSWNVPYGDYLFTWQGKIASIAYAREAIVYTNGIEQKIANRSNTESSVGGFSILRGVTQISVTGSGDSNVRFTEDPYAAFVRIS